MVLCRCGCVTGLCILSWAGSLEPKLKSLNFIIQILILYNRVSDVTLGPFLGILCYVLGTKLDSVLPLRMRHKACSLCLADSLTTKPKGLNFIGP